MATWCPPCQDELPLMTGFAACYEDTGLVVVLVDVKEDEASVSAFRDGLGVLCRPHLMTRAGPTRTGARSPCRSTSG